jgi:hypothetical protein
VRILIFLFLVIASNLNAQQSVLMPLEVGNTWQYSRQTLLSSDTISENITEKLTVNFEDVDYDVYAMQSFLLPENTTDSLRVLFRNAAEGVWEFGMYNARDTLILRNLLFKYPAMVGDTTNTIVYSISDEIVVTDTITVELIAIDEPVVTSVGTFDCHVFYSYVLLENEQMKTDRFELIYGNQIITIDPGPNKSMPMGFEIFTYLAPNVGKVAVEVKDQFIIYNSQRLLSYELFTGLEERPSVRINNLHLEPNYPNPFNPTTRFVYALTIPQHVKIDIFDIRGRLLNSFEEGLKPSGRHMLFWDGIDASGQALASGVYFYRVTAGQETQTGRALLIK